VIHHDGELFSRGNFDEFLSLGNVSGEGFLDENMLPIFQCSLRQRKVMRNRVTIATASISRLSRMSEGSVVTATEG
jgi:hypothetical protein